MGTMGRGLLIRTTDNSRAVRDAIYHAVWSTDKRVASTMLLSIDYYLELNSYAVPRFSFYIVTTFALIGLVLVTIGVYSVIAYNTTQRTHEIGIRVALGAAQGDVLGMVLRQGFSVLIVGIAFGMAASLLLARGLVSLLWGVSPYDPATAGTVVALLLCIGLLACWFPARRATRVDPMTALRYE
jgi:putative ABC transport system permease protein